MDADPDPTYIFVVTEKYCIQVLYPGYLVIQQIYKTSNLFSKGPVPDPALFVISYFCRFFEISYRKAFNIYQYNNAFFKNKPSTCNM